MELTLTILQGKNGYLVGRIKEIPSVMSQGKNESDLKKNMLDALNLYLDDVREEYIAYKTSIIKEEPLTTI